MTEVWLFRARLRHLKVNAGPGYAEPINIQEFRACAIFARNILFVLLPGTSFPPRSLFSPVSYHSTFASQAHSFLYHRRCTAWILTASLCLLQATQPPCHVSALAVGRVTSVNSLKCDAEYPASCQALQEKDHLHFGRQQFLSIGVTRLFRGVL